MSKTKSTLTENQLLKSTMAELKVSMDEFEEADKVLQEKREKVGKAAVAKLKDLITLSPHIEAIRWNQYTPYFNDGEECTFSVNELEIKFAEDISGAGDHAADQESEDDDEDSNEEFHSFGEYGDDITEYLNKRTDVINFKDVAHLEKVVDACYKIHGRLGAMEDTLKAVFGDHVEVTVTRDGIETESYDHE